MISSEDESVEKMLDRRDVKLIAGRSAQIKDERDTMEKAGSIYPSRPADEDVEQAALAIRSRR
jgi:hypothetical protein